VSNIPGTERPRFRFEDEPEWVDDARYRRAYVLRNDQGQDEPTYLYTIGALAEALGKSPVTVRKWIRTGVLPEPSWRTANVVGSLADAGRRLYLREQIEVIVAIAKAEGVIGVEGRTRVQSLSSTAFKSRVWKMWEQRRWL
jgi:hypothetical protein